MVENNRIDRQERFENNIILESELPRFYNNDESFTLTLDNLSEYLTLDELMSEYGKDIDFEHRKFLQIMIKQRLSQLTKIQKQIAELRYLENLTIRQIRDRIDKSLSTIHHHLRKIDQVIMLTTVNTVTVISSVRF